MAQDLDNILRLEFLSDPGPFLEAAGAARKEALTFSVLPLLPVFKETASRCPLTDPLSALKVNLIKFAKQA